MEFNFISKNINDTYKLAKSIVSFLKPGMIITLNGDLGAGKTTFVQGLGKALNINDNINSPTFNILKCYFDGDIPLYHIDAYRLEDRINDDIGLEEVIYGDGVCVIEWSIFIKDMITNNLNIDIELLDDCSRKFSLSSDDEKYFNIINELKEGIL